MRATFGAGRMGLNMKLILSVRCGASAVVALCFPSLAFCIPIYAICCSFRQNSGLRIQVCRGSTEQKGSVSQPEGLRSLSRLLVYRLAFMPFWSPHRSSVPNEEFISSIVHPLTPGLQMPDSLVAWIAKAHKNWMITGDGLVGVVVRIPKSLPRQVLGGV